MRRAAAALLLMGALVAQGAAVKWWEAYRKGVVAAQGRDWNGAIEQLEIAIAQRPSEALAAPAARNQTIEYVPHFWLGVARFNLGDIEGATREWDISQAQGVIQRTQNYSVLQSYRAQARTAQEKKTNERSADSRRSADAALKRALGSRMTAMTAGADRLESYRAAGRRLQEAWDKFNGAGSDVAEYRGAAALAAEAESMFAAAADEARAQKSARAAAPPVRTPQRRAPAPAPVQQPSAQQPPPQTATQAPVVQETSPVRVETAAPEAASPRRSTQFIVARTAIERLQNKVNAARVRGVTNPAFTQFLSSAARSVDGWKRELTPELDDDSAAEIEREVISLERRLADELKAVARITPPAELEKGLVRARLLNAYVAFANSKMDEADAQLTALIGSHPEVAEAFLLRGCVRYSQGILQSDKSLLRSAESDFGAALRLNRDLGLDSRHFSPKLIAALHSVRDKQRR